MWRHGNNNVSGGSRRLVAHNNSTPPPERMPSPLWVAIGWQPQPGNAYDDVGDVHGALLIRRRRRHFSARAWCSVEIKRQWRPFCDKIYFGLMDYQEKSIGIQEARQYIQHPSFAAHLSHLLLTFPTLGVHVWWSFLLARGISAKKVEWCRPQLSRVEATSPEFSPRTLHISIFCFVLFCFGMCRSRRRIEARTCPTD